jgi:pimeloyl-ACP methyl ester carboxylesterase
MIFRSPCPDVAIPEMGLTPFVLRHAERLADKPALIDGPSGRVLTYGQLADGVRRMAAGLAQRGFRKGAVFATVCPNVLEFAVAFYGGKVRRDPSLLRHLEREVPNRGGERYQTLAVLGWTSLLYLRGVRQPTLVLHGDEDNLVPMLNARLLARLLPNAQLHVFHDGHIGLITSAAEIAPVIEAFRNGAEAAAA